MYIERINGDVYLTVETGAIKRKLTNLVNETLSWIVAGVCAVSLLSVIYYGIIAYNYLTNLF